MGEGLIFPTIVSLGQLMRIPHEIYLRTWSRSLERILMTSLMTTALRFCWPCPIPGTGSGRKIAEQFNLRSIPTFTPARQMQQTTKGPIEIAWDKWWGHRAIAVTQTQIVHYQNTFFINIVNHFRKPEHRDQVPSCPGFRKWTVWAIQRRSLNRLNTHLHSIYTFFHT